MHVEAQPDISTMTALGTIREEHQALASMLQGLAALVRGIRDRQLPANIGLLQAMLYYVETFPERTHHPKEDRWLFPLLELRHPPSRPLLDLLREQHRIGGGKLRNITKALDRFERTGAAAFAPFADAVDDFVAFERDHMAREEREVLPLAQQYLTADDWARIDAAFAANLDPLRGMSHDGGQDELHRRLGRLGQALGSPAGT
jgi:hemerythrin-like domain-containing protein